MKIKCEICGELVHIIESHIVKHGYTIESYRAEFPGAPLLSSEAMEKLRTKIRPNGKHKKFSIKKTFGVQVSKNFPEVTGYENPCELTPAIDPDYHFHDKAVLGSILYALETPNEFVQLTGPTGSGKSSQIEQACARLNLPVLRMNFTAETGLADFVGQWVVTENENGGTTMKYTHGTLPRAMRLGAVLILDEWDFARPEILAVLQPVLEGGNLLILETGEIIKPHPDFRIFSTANTNGQGDDTGLYAGTSLQNFATIDRWTIVEKVEYPKEAIEAAVLAKKGQLLDLAETEQQRDEAKAEILKFIEVGNKVRASFLEGECTCTLSTRTLINVVRKYVLTGDAKRAWEMSYTNKLSKDDAMFVKEIVQRIFG